MRQEHRTRFRDELRQLVTDVADLADYVSAATDDADRALLRADDTLAAEVIERRWRVDAMAEAIDSRTSELITLQAPVAGDLRLLVSVLRASAALRRIGDLAIHIAELVLRRHPEPSVPAGFTPVVTALAEAVSRVTHAAAAAIRQGNEPGPEIRRLDDDVDALHRDLLHLLTVNDARLRPDATVDLTLLGRYLERIGDQAVNATAWRRDPVGAA